jgi:hypothetical protein
VNLSSVRELEAKSAIERKKLMQTIFSFLGRSGINGKLIQEPALDSLGVSVMEPAIQLIDREIDIIRLFRMSGAGCGGSENILRFQYELKMEKGLRNDFFKRLNARTKTIKTGKVMGLFGGRVVGYSWTGQELATVLNRDTELSEGLLRCDQLWGEMSFEIDATSPPDVHISGPWIGNPATVIQLYSPGREYEEQNCVLGLKTVEKIARHIKEL